MKTLEFVLNVIAAAGIFLLAFLVFLSVFFRYLLNSPIIMTEDLMTVLLGLTIFAAYPRVTARREHISVDLLSGALSSFPRLEGIRRVIVDIVSLGAVIFIGFRLWEQAVKYHARGTFSPTMEWSLWPAVAAFAALVAVSVVLFAIRIIAGWSGQIRHGETRE